MFSTIFDAVSELQTTGGRVSGERENLGETIPPLPI
jgi:hypothetical protein